MQNKDWNGKNLDCGESTGGRLAVRDYTRLLLNTSHIAEPTAEILQKLTKTWKFKGKTPGDDNSSTIHLGCYSDLQSLTSEDTITWSFIGLLSYEPIDIQGDFVSWCFREIEVPISRERCADAHISLWRRLPHWHTQGRNGSEPDSIITAGDFIVLAEHKWIEPAKLRKQIAALRSYVELLGPTYHPNVRDFVLLSIYLPAATKPKELPHEDSIDLGSGRTLHIRNLPWSVIAGYRRHPARAELVTYYQWRLKMCGITERPMPVEEA